MSWEEIEFNCNDCNMFFIVRLHKRYARKEVLVQCPNPKCGRKHPRMANAAGNNFDAMDLSQRLYRTGDGPRLSRSGGRENQGDVIIGLEATLSKESRFDKVKASDLEKRKDKGGFLASLWLRTIGK